jgi:hypothetical protein
MADPCSQKYNESLTENGRAKGGDCPTAEGCVWYSVSLTRVDPVVQRGLAV